MRDAQVRAVDAIRSWNAKLGPDATWLAVLARRHHQVIVADALGMHLDTFQRIVIDPCSVTVISYTSLRPFVVRVNDTGSDLATLLTPPEKERAQARVRRPAAMPWSAAAPAPIGSSICPVRSFVYDPPERLVIGTVGQPGERTFFLQARGAGQLTSVVLEKVQVAALGRAARPAARRGASRIGRDVVGARSRALELNDTLPLDQPIVEEFRVGALGLGWDPETERVVVEALAVSDPVGRRDRR